MKPELRSPRAARDTTIVPATAIHPAIATPSPHCPGDTQTPGSASSAKTTPKQDGLNRCLPRTRKSDFDPIAMAAAAGCTHNESARSSSEILRAVMSALR